MYYKITDKNSDLYKKLHGLRTEEHKIEEENLKKVKELVGDDWDEFVGHRTQQNICRVTRYSGFKFKHPESMPPKTFKPHKEFGNKGFYVPDRRTKAGKNISDGLRDLKQSPVFFLLEIFGVDYIGHYHFPFVEICKNETIVVYMDERFDKELRKFHELVEITSKEFYELLNQE